MVFVCVFRTTHFKHDGMWVVCISCVCVACIYFCVVSSVELYVFPLYLCTLPLYILYKFTLGLCFPTHCEGNDAAMLGNEYRI